MGKPLLLLGAGFTKNFGGYLSAEVWTQLFNNSQFRALSAVKEIFLSDQDFESVYYKILTRGNIEEIDTVSKALLSVYRQLDRVICDFNFTPGSPYPVNIYNVQKLIRGFAGVKGDPGYIFTLNQDLFLERHYLNGPRPVLPGIKQRTEWFAGSLVSSPLLAEPVGLMDAAELEESRPTIEKYYELVYLKLHGSFNWHSSQHLDQMVIGRGKSQQIERNPLLQWYFQLFQTQIQLPETRLLLIGYGFGDPHINTAIANAVDKSSLSLYIMDPTPTDVLLDRINQLPEADTLKKGFRAFYTTPLKELFPANQAETVQWEGIQRDFFGRSIL
jgi:hypothetical protein